MLADLQKGIAPHAGGPHAVVDVLARAGELAARFRVLAALVVLGLVEGFRRRAEAAGGPTAAVAAACQPIGGSWSRRHPHHQTPVGQYQGREIHQVDPRTGEVLQALAMSPGMGVSGLAFDGGERFFCGGGKSGKVRVVRRPS